MSEHAIRSGPFTLLRPLGEGGSGQVWLATTSSGHEVAVKLFPGSVLDGAARSEARAVARLVHPHVVSVHDFGELESGPRAGTPYLVMDYADAGALTSRTHASWEQVRHALLEILDGLGHAHAHRVVHLDLKPANVLLFDAGEHRLADFGISLGPTGTASSTMSRGTPPYMAPEQVRGDRAALGPPTDLYALGCTAWQLVTGRPPYRGNAREVMASHLAGTLPPLAPRMPVPAGLEDWLRGLLAVAPEMRFQLAADAAEVLRHLSRLGRGGAGLPRAVRAPRAREAVPTWSFEALDAGPAVSRPVAAMPPAAAPPADWRPKRAAGRLPFSGLGARLHALREPLPVGREVERDRLWEHLRAVSRLRAPRSVRLTGPSGIGKTCVASWLLRRAEETGAAVAVRARCTDPDPIRALALDALVHPSLPPSLQGHAIRHRCSALGLSGWIADELERCAEGRTPGDWAVLRLFGRMADMRPLVVLLDDVDEQPAVNGFVARLLERGPFLVVGTAAAAAPDGEGWNDTLSLSPLDSRERHELVRGIMGLEAGLAAAMAEASRGHPGEVRLLVDGLVARGALVRTDVGLALGPGEEWDLATRGRGGRLAAALAARPASDMVPVEVLAAFDGPVDVADWRACCGAPPAPDLVEALLDAGVFRRVGERIDLSHPRLAAEAAAAAKQADRWKGHHSRIVEWLRARDGPPSDRLGHHLLQAGEAARAIPLLFAAVGNARREGRYRDGLRLLVTYDLALAEAGTPETRLAGCAEHAQMLNHLGRYAEAEQWARMLIEGARDLGDGELYGVGLMMQVKAAFARGDRAASTAILDEAREHAVALGNPTAIVRTGVMRALYAPDLATALAALDEVALHVGSPELPPMHRAQWLWQAGTRRVAVRGQESEARSFLTQAAAVFAEEGAAHMELCCRYELVRIDVEVGSDVCVLDELDAIASLCLERGWTSFWVDVCNVQAVALVLRGDCERAEIVVRNALDRLEPWQRTRANLLYFNLALAMVGQARFEAARKVHARLRALPASMRFELPPLPLLELDSAGEDVVARTVETGDVPPAVYTACAAAALERGHVDIARRALEVAAALGAPPEDLAALRARI